MKGRWRRHSLLTRLELSHGRPGSTLLASLFRNCADVVLEYQKDDAAKT